MSIGRTDSSLTALSAYAEDSDAENETSKEEVDNISGSDDEASNTQPITVKPKGEKRDRSPVEEAEKNTSSRKTMKLVSYEGDIDDEDEEEEDASEDEEQDDQSPDGQSETANLVNYDVSHNSESGAFTRSLLLTAADEALLPPEPPGKCSKRLQEKMAGFYEKVHKGHDINASIQRRKDFRNPSIFEKLLQFCDIDEKGTNYPPKLYDPTIYGKESYYDVLAKAQKTEMDRREKEKKDRTKVEFVNATVKKSGSELPVTNEKRKSKWDTQPVVKPAVLPTVIPPTISMTTSSSGSKTTVISTVGVISKKSK